MSAPGAPLSPIPPSVRWAGRALGWIAVIGFWVFRAVDGNPDSPLGAPLLLGVFWLAVALETHRWLPTQNTVAAALLMSAVGGLLSPMDAGRSKTGFALEVLIGFSHILSSRGLIRCLLRPWRTHPRYGVGVLGATALLAGVSVDLSRIAVGQAPSIPALGIQPLITGLALLSGTVWLLVKKPVREVPNPHPAGLWILLSGCQCLVLARTGHPAAAAVAGGMSTLGLLGLGWALRREGLRAQ